MRKLNITSVGLVAITALLGTVAWGGAADTTPPTITWQAPTPAEGATVSGMVYFRARVADSGGIRSVALTVPNASASMWPSNSPPWATIQVGWDNSDDPPGTYTATCTAIDTHGNRAIKTRTVQKR